MRASTLAGTTALLLFSTAASAETVLFDSTAGMDAFPFSVPSSKFTDSDGSFNGQSVTALDDFEVTDAGWTLTRITARGVYIGAGLFPPQLGPAESVSVYLLDGAAQPSGNMDLSNIALWSAEELSYSDLGGGDLQMDLPSPLVLAQGTYQLAVVANIEVQQRGAWAWTESSPVAEDGSTLGSESRWKQSAPMLLSPVSGITECVVDWGARISDCKMTSSPDLSPPADGDLAFILEGDVLTAGVSVSPTMLVTSEGGAAQEFEVHLLAPPAPGSSVSIAIGPPDPSEGALSLTSLEFTSGNFDIPRTVSVTPLSDGIVDGDAMYTLVLGPASSDDLSYDGMAVDAVAVTNIDIDLIDINLFGDGFE